MPELRVIRRHELDALVALLIEEGFEVVAPCARDGAITYAPIESSTEFASGWAMEQEAGSARLVRRDDGAVFGYATGAQNWKRWLRPPVDTIFEVRREDGSFSIVPRAAEDKRRAFFGVRPCDLSGIAVQDRIFLRDKFVDASYARRREGVFIVAVNCSNPAATCFCASTSTGPFVRSESGDDAPYDLLLTELVIGEHRFLVQSGSDRGLELVGRLSSSPASRGDFDEAEQLAQDAAKAIRRSLDLDALGEVMGPGVVDHPHWQEVAKKCLACTNCTMVCPTCFCSTVEDSSSVDGRGATRRRLWDSCFSQSFSYIHGGSVRASLPARYRQWFTHKLGTFSEQFDCPGCVGCGRCITWCPVGIDITEEARVLIKAPAVTESVG